MEVSAFAGGMALLAPASRSELMVRVGLGMGPAVSGRLSSGVMDGMVQYLGSSAQGCIMVQTTAVVTLCNARQWF